MTRKHLRTFSLGSEDSTLLLSPDNYVESVSIFVNKGAWVLSNKPSKIPAVQRFWKSNYLLKCSLV